MTANRVTQVSTMNSIRFFLWSLVAAMTLQGFFHADEYGSAASMIGGMSLTLSVWNEALGEKLRSMFGSGPTYTGIPRALALAAIQESARHPGLGSSAPQLRRALQDVQGSATAFTDAHVGWMLRQTAIVGALQSDPVGRALWTPWNQRVDIADQKVKAAAGRLCGPMESRIAPAVCKNRTEAHSDAVATLADVKAGQVAWSAILRMEPMRTRDWWGSTHQYGVGVELFGAFYRNLTLLHDVTSRTDPRIALLLGRTKSMAATLVIEGGLRRTLTESLLVQDMWVSCRDHVADREGRIRELVVATGIQEMFSIHDRILNASLRVVSSKAERDMVGDWFSEMSAQAWWLSEDMPAIVRRCVGHEGGDCRRIGPTEIAALIAQADVAATIVKDWTRRLFIGMWNALPAVGLLFVVELAVLCVGIRGPQMLMIGSKKGGQKRIGSATALPALTVT